MTKIEEGLKTAPPRAGAEPSAGFRLTDTGNAERLVHQHGSDIRYAPGIGWHTWDGRRWRYDTDGELMRRAKKTVRSMYAQAAEIDDADQRKRLLAWASASESEARRNAAVSLARYEHEVIVQPNELDAAPFLFNAINCTIDLRTGKERQHRREDLLTKISPTRYIPGLTSKLWDRFLERVTGEDHDLAGFLRRAAGYSLTGITSEDKLFFAHGPTATGKSTKFEALRAALGEYAMTADFETFLKRRGDTGIRNDIARLAGARLVVSIEVDDGKQLAEGLLKLLTGGDTVAARFLYRETFEFEPKFKLWLAANARPRVNADDAAIWRRILLIPFICVIPEEERDERLRYQLRTDPDVQSAILDWAVQGCLEWQQIGLDPPECVLAYTAEYRAENDPIAEWLGDCCELAPLASTPTTALRASYEQWAAANGEKPVNTKTWAAALQARGCEKDRTGAARYWRGIALRDTT